MTSRARIALLLAAFALAACDPIDVQRAKIESGLPAGCKLHDIGRYKGIDVLAVTCEGRPTSTNNLYWRAGKVSHYASITWIGDYD